MSLKTRIQALEKQFGAAPNALPRPHLCTVYVHGKAPCVELEPKRGGPIGWATIEGIPEIFERGLDESQDDFFHRVSARAPRLQAQFAELSVISVYTFKPELPEILS